jgi:putative tryptophan/tyrosine transport system substrate-binding protein
MDRRGRHLSHRQFVAGAVGLGLLAGCGRLPGQRQAQQPVRIPRVGILYAARGATSNQAHFIQTLREIGHVDGQTVVIETRVAAGRADLMATYVDELIRLPVDVIVAVGSPATLAARKATDRIPIVQAFGAADLVREGIVASLARPGGNVTGLTEIAPELSAKRLELLKQAVPGLSRVAVLWNPGFPSAVLSWEEIQGAAQILGVRVHSMEVRRADDLDSLFAAATRERADGLVVLTDAITVTEAEQIAGLAAEHRLPGIFDRREFAAAGGLMSYGPDAMDMAQRAAVFVHKILEGAKPSDLPIERPVRFTLVVNLKTAEALTITLPNEIRLQVTEVLQ